LLKIINGISNVPPSREEQRILAYEAMTDKLKPDRERFPSLRFVGQGFSQSASSTMGRRRMEEIVMDVDEENSSTSSSILPVLRDGDKWPEQSDSSMGCSNHVGFSASSGDALGIDAEVFSEWDIDNFPEMGKILSKLDLVQHVDRFRDEEVDVEAFLLMGDNDLVKMGIKLGGRKKLIHAISYLKASKASKFVMKKQNCADGMPNRV